MAAKKNKTKIESMKVDAKAIAESAKKAGFADAVVVQGSSSGTATATLVGYEGKDDIFAVAGPVLSQPGTVAMSMREVAMAEGRCVVALLSQTKTADESVTASAQATEV